MNVAGDKHYKVTMLGRAGIVYKEGHKEVLIDSELLAGGEYDYVVYLDKVATWDYPNDIDPFSSEDKATIKERISKSLGRANVDWK